MAGAASSRDTAHARAPLVRPPSVTCAKGTGDSSLAEGAILRWPNGQRRMPPSLREVARRALGAA